METKNPHGNRPRTELDRSTDRGELGARIREARDRRGLDLYEAARLAGLTHGGLGRIERGENDTRVSTVLAICKALAIDAGELLRGMPRGQSRGQSRGKKKRS